MPQPHNNNGHYYDYVYEQAYGASYHHLTGQHLRSIDAIISSHNCKSFIDYGAGTGRITIPLLQRGLSGCAVEPSLMMLNQLDQKLRNENLNNVCDKYNTTIIDYKKHHNHKSADLALVLFTVFAYITNHNELEESINVISESLNQGGHLYFGLEGQHAFSGTAVNKPTLQRTVTVTPDQNDQTLYNYYEKATGIFNNAEFEYEEHFQIRNWDFAIIQGLLNKKGLFRSDNPNVEGVQAGANYYLFKKGHH